MLILAKNLSGHSDLGDEIVVITKHTIMRVRYISDKWVTRFVVFRCATRGHWVMTLYKNSLTTKPLLRSLTQRYISHISMLPGNVIPMGIRMVWFVSISRKWVISRLLLMTIFLLLRIVWMIARENVLPSKHQWWYFLKNHRVALDTWI